MVLMSPSCPDLQSERSCDSRLFAHLRRHTRARRAQNFARAPRARNSSPVPPEHHPPPDHRSQGQTHRFSTLLLRRLVPVVHGGRERLVVEGGASSALGRPEAGCWADGKPPSCSGGAPGGRRSGVRAFRWCGEVEGALRSDRVKANSSRLPCEHKQEILEHRQLGHVRSHLCELDRSRAAYDRADVCRSPQAPVRHAATGRVGAGRGVHRPTSTRCWKVRSTNITAGTE